MRKISAMYEWSGGTDYRHICYECRNCQKVKKGNRSVYKCMAYGNTDSASSDWKASYIACKHFNKPVPAVPVIRITKREQDAQEIEGQLNIEEYFTEVMT